MTQERADPTAIMQLATGYWNSATLLAANELDLFGALAAQPQTAAQIGENLHLAVRAATMLLDACVGLGLLHKEPGTNGFLYRNTPAAQAFLVPGQPGYLGSALQWGADQYPLWGRLAQSVRTDAPAESPAQHLGQDPERTRRFVLGMHNRAQGVARGLVEYLDFSEARTLLDVGGGPGTYAILLAQRYPGLRVTVLDLPEVVAIAQELIDAAGVSEQVPTHAGDATTDDYGLETYDAVLFSGVLHQMSPSVIGRMLGKAYRALRPGGRVVISDLMLDPTKTQPAFAALFSLQMLLTSQEGAVFSTEECAGWLEQAGFSEVHIQPLPPPLPYTLLTGNRGG